MSEKAGHGSALPDGTPLEIARAVIQQAESLGADVEVYAELSRTVTVKVHEGGVESVTTAEPRGVGIRAVRGGKTAYVSTTVMEPAGIDLGLSGLREHLECVDVDPHAGLPPMEEKALPVVDGLWSPGVGETSLDEKTELALSAESTALAREGIETVEETVYSDEESWVAVVSTKGVEAEERTTQSFVYTVAQAAREGERQTGLGFSAARSPQGLDARAAGKEAARKALDLLGGRPCRSGVYTVVLDSEVSAALFASVVQALSAEAVQKGRSVFAGKVGEMVAAPGVTLVDDGLHAEGLSTRPFDGEGVPQQRTVLVDGGVLSSYLFDSRAARREGGRTRSTGNAVRASYRSLPRVGATNLVVSPGSGSMRDLLTRVGEGILVEGVAGVHAGVNPVSGEISLGLTGRLIKGGSVSAPVREVTMATDFLSLLKGVCEVGEETRWVPLYGSVCAPALVVEGVTISGG